jgi:hypothetical protein
MRVLLGDPPIDWSKITTLSEFRVFAPQRDPHAASVIQAQVLDQGRRALICYGWAYLFHKSGLAGIIERRTGERTYTIADLVPLAGDPGGLASRLSRFPQDRVIPTAGTWLGSVDTGLIAPTTQGPDNPWCGVRLGSLIDAGLYLGQPEDLTASWPNPAIYLDPAYWAELQRRNALKGNRVDLDSYRKEQPARFPLQQLLPSQECGNA